MQRSKIEEGTRLILEGLGVDPRDHNFAETPARVAGVYAELFTPEDTGWPVFEEDHTDMVTLRGFEFHTLCPHHLLPVRIKAYVAYKPAGRVIGASKLGRMLLEANRLPRTQEALTDLAVSMIDKYTEHTSLGAAVLLIGEHGCFRVRGIKTQADMVTQRFEGCFKDDPEMRARFWEVIKL